jgi:hypothetical protein
MLQMNKKIVTRVGLEYFPPTLKIEYKNGQRREKYQSHIRMKTYFDRYASGYPHMSTVERSMEIKAIVNALLEKHYELQQLPSKTLEIMIEKLYTNHTQNNDTITDTITGTSAGEEDRDEQSTSSDDGDATRDDTIDHKILDDTRDGTSDRAFVSTRDGTFDDTQVRSSDV